MKIPNVVSPHTVDIIIPNTTAGDQRSPPCGVKLCREADVPPQLCQKAPNRWSTGRLTAPVNARSHIHQISLFMNYWAGQQQLFLTARQNQRNFVCLQTAKIWSLQTEKISRREYTEGELETSCKIPVSGNTFSVSETFDIFNVLLWKFFILKQQTGSLSGLNHRRISLFIKFYFTLNFVWQVTSCLSQSDSKQPITAVEINTVTLRCQTPWRHVIPMRRRRVVDLSLPWCSATCQSELRAQALSHRHLFPVTYSDSAGTVSRVWVETGWRFISAAASAAGGTTCTCTGGSCTCYRATGPYWPNTWAAPSSATEVRGHTQKTNVYKVTPLRV